MSPGAAQKPSSNGAGIGMPIEGIDARHVGVLSKIGPYGFCLLPNTTERMALPSIPARMPSRTDPEDKHGAQNRRNYVTDPSIDTLGGLCAACYP
ncbi:MAG: hypothetical protein QXI39_08725 [Candidatus Bathyarchaeia archaeon]